MTRGGWILALAAAVLSTDTAQGAALHGSGTLRGKTSATLEAKRKGTIVYLVDGTPSRVADVCNSLKALDRYFNNEYHYPVTLFHPQSWTDSANVVHVSGESAKGGDAMALTEQDKKAIRGCSTSDLNFAEVRFEEYVPEAVRGNIPELVHGRFPVGYRHMCNFFAGPIANHPALADFRYYWRLDTDAELVETIREDLFEKMAVNSWRYAYANDQCDWHKVTEGLYPTIREVVGEQLDAKLDPRFADDSCQHNEVWTPYNNRIFYNNFEVVDLEFLRSTAYQSIYEHVSAAGGIFTNRWGDAPIRTIAVQALLPPAAVHKLVDVSYHHQGYYGPIITHLIMAGVMLALLLASIVVYLLPALRKRCMACAHRAAAVAQMMIRSWVSRLCYPCYCLLDWTACCCAFRIVHVVELGNRFAWPGAVWLFERSPVAARLQQLCSLRRVADSSGPRGGEHEHATTSTSSIVKLQSVARQQFLRFGVASLIIGGLLFLTSRERLNSTIYPGSGVFGLRQCFPDELECLLSTRADPRKRVVVTGANIGMLDFVENLLYSLHAQGVYNYVIFAFDEEVAAHLISRNVPTYWDPAPLSSLKSVGSQAESGLSSGLTVAHGAPSTAGNAFLYGSKQYQAITMRKNELIYEVLKLGYNAFFTDADTVWLQNPLNDELLGPEYPPATKRKSDPPGATNRFLGHRCNELRLGDTTSPLGELNAQQLERDTCGNTQQYPYDVKGMYGDTGGMDTGFWYIRSTDRSKAHMKNVIDFQRTPAGLEMTSDQDTFNEMLKPWLPEHLTDSRYAKQVIDSDDGFGPAKMRVAMFDPLEVPNGCRFKVSVQRRIPLLLVHANCRTGWWEKVPWMFIHGVWFVRLWKDWHVLALTTVLAAAISIRFWFQHAIIAPVAAKPPRHGSNLDYAVVDDEDGSSVD